MSLNLAIITNLKGNLQIAEGNGHYYIVYVYPDGYFEPEREITREVLWLAAYTLDAPLERLDFKQFDLRPESDWELEQEQSRLAQEEENNNGN